MDSTEPISNKPIKTTVHLESATSQQEDVKSDTRELVSNLEKDGTVIDSEQSQSDTQQQTDTEKQPEASEESSAVFQAVGVITGEVNFILDGENERSTITIGNKNTHYSMPLVKKELTKRLRKR
jgi:hypothetical protein